MNVHDPGPPWPLGESEMARLIREHDWGATPAGAIERWPERLRVAVEMMLADPRPASLAVARGRTFLFNDAAARLYGSRAPRLLGVPLPQAFPSYPAVAGFYDRAFAGEAGEVRAMPLAVTEEGREVFDATLLPVGDGAGGVLAVLATSVEVGGRLRTEMALRESEARFRTLTEAAPALIWWNDAEGSNTFVNQHFRDYTGLAPEAIAGGAWQALVHPDDAGPYVAGYLEAVRGRRAWQDRNRIRRHDGAWRSFENHARPVFGPRGAYLGHIGVSLDVTESLAAAEALRQSEARQAFLLTLSDAMRPLTDPVAIQEAACRVLGEHLKVDWAQYSAIDVEGGLISNVRDYYRGSDRPSHVGACPLDNYPVHAEAWRAGRPVAVADAAADPTLSEGERSGLLACGVRAALTAPLVRGGAPVVVMAALSASPRPWSPEEVGLLEETAERTWGAVERARAEAALRESEERYRTLFETMGEGFVVGELIRDARGKAVDFRYLELNPAVERLVGWNAKETVGRLMSDMIPAAETRYWVNGFETIVATGSSSEFEHFHESLGQWFRANATPVGADRIAVVCQNVTARKRAELSRRESEKRHAFLLKLSDDFRAHPDEEAVGRTCVEAMARHMGLDRCYITELSGELNRGLAGPEYGTPGLPPISGVHPYTSYLGTMRNLMDGESFVTSDVDQDPRLSETDKASIAAGLGLRAMISAPLCKGGGNSIWALTVGTAEPRAWTGDDLRLVQEVGERTWAAIQRARAEAVLRESEALQAGQAEAFQAALGGAPLEEALDALLRAASARFGDVRGAFYVLEPGGATLRLVAGMGGGYAQDVNGFGVGIDPLACGLAAAPGQPIIPPDARKEPAREPWPRRAETQGCRGVWSIPVPPSKGPALGTLALYFEHPREATREDRAFADTLAKAAAIIVSRHQEAQDRVRAEAALRDTEERLRSFGEASSDVLWIRDAETLAWEYLSPAFERIYGLSRDEALRGDTMGNWIELIVPEDRARAQGEIEKVRRGEPVTFEYRITRPSDGEVRLLRNTDFPIRDAAGRIIRIGGVGHDATEEQAAAERLRVLVHELQHRTRNLMGVVQSVTNRTLAGSDSLEDFQGRIRDRLGALARVNGLLSRLKEGDRISFDELIRTELKGHGVINGQDHGPQVDLHGPAGLRLRSSQVQTLALGLHELATNALKYGALSHPEGRLDVGWSLIPGPDGQRRLRVDWRERNGTDAGLSPGNPGEEATDGTPPRRRGYGRELIEQALPYQLGAETTYELTPEGVRCTITLPLSSTLGAGGPDLEDDRA